MPWVPLGASWVSPGCLLGASWVPPGCLLGLLGAPLEPRCPQMPPRCLSEASQSIQFNSNQIKSSQIKSIQFQSNKSNQIKSNQTKQFASIQFKSFIAITTSVWGLSLESCPNLFMAMRGGYKVGCVIVAINWRLPAQFKRLPNTGNTTRTNSNNFPIGLVLECYWNV